MEDLSAADSIADQRLYQVLLDAMPASVLRISRNLRVVSANRNFLEKSRRTEAETLNRALPDILNSLDLTDVDLTQRIQQVFKSGEPTAGEKMVYRAPGGLMRTYYYRIIPLVWDQRVDSVLFLMDDVTEQARLSQAIHQMERHLAIVIENIREMVVSTDRDGAILSWNESAERLSGFTRREVQGRRFFELGAEEHQAEIRQAFGKLKKRRKSLSAEWGLVTKGGNVVSVSWTCSPMLDEQLHTLGIVATGRDLTERRKLEAELLQAQKMAALGVMAGGIAHEILNPLTICSSAAQFLTEEERDAQFRQECVQKIQTGISRASGIVENLLRFARPSVGAELARLELLAVLREALDSLADPSQTQGVAVSTGFPQEPVLVRGVASFLRQVFVNLFRRALQAMPAGGCLEVSVEKKPKEWWVRVSDTGRGFSPLELENIFVPFYLTTPAVKDNGLELALCHFIVKHHGGAIAVQGRAGPGVTFTVKLPACYE